MITVLIGIENRSLLQKTKLIIINNPHNPTGKILRHSDFTALEHIMEKFPKILLLSDEVYEHIAHLRRKHISAVEQT
jgi:methionine aminotransferase